MSANATVRQMHLNAFVLFCPAPVVRLSWVYPEDKIRHQWWEMGFWDEIATTLERGSFDALFFADNMGGYGADADSIKFGMHFPLLDPAMLVPRLAAKTNNLGYVVTMSTTFTPPYQLARSMQTLDHVTEGRIAWNIVTSTNPHEGDNLDIELPAHDERYERAHEYMDVVHALWESFEPDAIIMDHENRIMTDSDKVHRIDFKGKWYASAGPLSVMPGPQGKPVLAQAGASEAGLSFAAKHAELVFAPGASDEQRRDMVADLRTRASDQARDPYDLKIMFTHGPIVGETTADAIATQQEILARPGYDADIAALRPPAGFDLSDLPPETPLSEILPRVTGMRGRLRRRCKIAIRRLPSLQAASETWPPIAGSSERQARLPIRSKRCKTPPTATAFSLRPPTTRPIASPRSSTISSPSSSAEAECEPGTPAQRCARTCWGRRW